MKNIISVAMRLTITALVIFLFSSMQPLAAQTGVLVSGSAGTADPSAMLELRAADKGLLLPRVTLGSLTDATSPVNSPATGLLVYNTAGAQPVGLYYWNGTSWVKLTSGGFSGTGVSNYLARWITSTDLQTGVVYDDGTNVGIGTSSPGARLHVFSSGDTRIRVESSSSSSDYTGYELRQAGAFRGGMFTQNNDTRLGFWNSNQEMLTLSNSNFVGIGTNAPIGRLDVMGTAARSGTGPTTPSFYVTGSLSPGTSGPAAGNVEFRHDNQTQGIGFGYQTIYAAASNPTQPLNLLSKGSDPITLNAYSYSTGNVGIGTISPLTKLDVNGQVKYGVSQTVSGASSITFSGLDGNTEKIYEIILVGKFTGTTNTNRTIRLLPNGSTSTAGFTNSAHRFGNCSLHDVDNGRNFGGFSMGFTDYNCANADFSMRGTLFAATGRPRHYLGTTLATGYSCNTTCEIGLDLAGWWTDTGTNITSLTIDFNGAAAGGTFTGTAILRTIMY